MCPCATACQTRRSEDGGRGWGHGPFPPGSSVLCLELRLILAWSKHSRPPLPLPPLFSTKRVLRVVHTPRFRPEPVAGHQPRAGGSSRRRGLQSGRQQTSSQHLYTPNVCLKSGRSEHPAAGSHASAWSCGSAPVPGPAPRPRPRAHWLSRAACLPRAPLLGALRTPAFHRLTPRPVPPGAAACRGHRSCRVGTLGMLPPLGGPTCDTPASLCRDRADSPVDTSPPVARSRSRVLPRLLPLGPRWGQAGTRRLLLGQNVL